VAEQPRGSRHGQAHKADDIQARVSARDVARQVEELTYPSRIRVTVVRESRAAEFAR
jgi:ribonuclease Y